MYRRTLPLLTLPLLLLSACPDKSSSSGTPSTTCPTCEPSAATADWSQLYTDLAAGGATTPPTFVPDGGTGLWEGETNIILNSPTAFSIGTAHTLAPVAPATAYTEHWVMYERQTLVQPPYPVRLQYVPRATPDQAQLTPARLAQYTALDTADTTRTYSIGKGVYSYLAFPSDTSINGLPIGLPPNTTSASYEVWSIKGSNPPERSGGLFRQVEVVGGVERWHDFWVLWDNFQSPYCSTAACDPTNPLTVLTELRLVVGAGAWPDLKSFLLGMKAQRPGPTTNWKYQDIPPYDLISPLPPNVP